MKAREDDAVRPDLTVLVAVYNHEMYVRQCIDSIRMQSVHFTMEVLIGEDCSTDGSRRILKDMEQQPDWPQNFQILYRENNLGMWENGADLYRRARGRYLIVLEGDDYWTFPYKLQRQFDFLERHPEYSGAAHRVLVVEDGRAAGTRHDTKTKYCQPDTGMEPWPRQERQRPVLRSDPGRNRNKDRLVRRGYPECRHPVYTLRDWCRFRLPGQTGTLMFRNYTEQRESTSVVCYAAEADLENRLEECEGETGGEGMPFSEGYPRDQQKALFLLMRGPIRCFPEVWSVYRYHPEVGTSFSGGEKVPWGPRRNFYRNAIRCLRGRRGGQGWKWLIIARFLVERLAVWYNNLLVRMRT